MIRRTWRVLVVGALVAAGVMLPGVADAAEPGCISFVTGVVTPTVPGVATVAGTIECLTGVANAGTLDNLPVIADPDAFIEVSMLYDDGSGWQTCADSGQVPLVYGTGAAAAASTCPTGSGYNYATHLHAHVRFQTPVTSTPAGCIHDAVGSVWITCYGGGAPIISG